jgi:hypothetical protein
MTQEEANKLYSESSWGVYKYTLRRKALVDELLRFNNENPENTILVCFNQHLKSLDLFDLGNTYFYLYYKQRDIKLEKEIVENKYLGHDWCDSDSYDLDNSTIKELKEQTQKTKAILLGILALSNKLEHLVGG